MACPECGYHYSSEVYSSEVCSSCFDRKMDRLMAARRARRELDEEMAAEKKGSTSGPTCGRISN